jgi:hypothetical protein
MFSKVPCTETSVICFLEISQKIPISLCHLQSENIFFLLGMGEHYNLESENT